MNQPHSPQPDWNKMNGLLPAIVQHALTGQVLMLGYMNSEAFRRTLEEGKVCFYSRSRQQLWLKGETSGHFLHLRHWALDCDRDTLLIQALPQGPTCHLGTPSCFGLEAENAGGFLQQLEQVLQQRLQQPPEQSYTRRLMDRGIARIAQKVGEEGVESALAAVCETDDGLKGELADLFYHVLVLLKARGLELEDILQTLDQRHRKT